AQRVLACGAHVLVGEIDARDAGVVGGEHNRHAGGEIGGQRMVLAADAENEITAGDAGLDCDRLAPHSEDQPPDVLLEGEPGAVPWPLRRAPAVVTASVMWKVRSSGGTRPSHTSPACSATGTSLARNSTIFMWAR